MDLLTGPLADALRRGRQTFNAKFAAATNAENPIDAAAFQSHLALIVDPIVRSVAAQFPEKTDSVADTLFDLSLELFRHSLLGPKARYPIIPEAWQRLLPRLPKLLAREPARVVGAITNALYNLSRTPGTNPQSCVTDLILSCESVTELLDCGAVLAWRSGMPQYRLGALEKAAALATPLAAQALGLAPGTKQIPEVVQTLKANPWIAPQDALHDTKRELKIVAKAGAFRGFGGQFLTPPKVQCIDGDLIASDGAGSWRLYADIHNAVFLRCEMVPPPLPPSITPAPADALLSSNGTLRWQGQERRFPELAQASSIAAIGHTVAVTIPTSHHLFLVGMS